MVQVKDDGFVSLKNQSKTYLIKRQRWFTVIVFLFGIVLGSINEQIILYIILSVLLLFFYAFEQYHIEKGIKELL
jgi:predicted membrane chloride channel (bestrophin family)